MPDAGPSKRLQEFMDVMKGVDASKPLEEGPAAKRPKKDKETRKPFAEESVSDEADNQPQDDDDDAAWLRGRRKELDTEEDQSIEPSAVLEDPEVALIRSTARLYVRNLPFVTTSSDLDTLFSAHGPLAEVHLATNSAGSPIGTAFIAFRHPDDALKAYKALDKTAFQGRLLHVLPGRAKPGQEGMDASEAAAGEEGKVLGKIKDSHQEVKANKAARRKEAGDKGVNWATLYMNVSSRTFFGHG